MRGKFGVVVTWADGLNRLSRVRSVGLLRLRYVYLYNPFYSIGHEPALEAEGTKI